MWYNDVDFTRAFIMCFIWCTALEKFLCIRESQTKRFGCLFNFFKKLFLILCYCFWFQFWVNIHNQFIYLFNLSKHSKEYSAQHDAILQNITWISKAMYFLDGEIPNLAMPQSVSYSRKAKLKGHFWPGVWWCQGVVLCLPLRIQRQQLLLTIQTPTPVIPGQQQVTRITSSASPCYEQQISMW